MRVLTTFTGPAGFPAYNTTYWTGSQGTDGPASAQDAATAMGAFWSALNGRISNTIDWEVDNNVQSINVETGNIEDVYAVTGPDGGGTSADARLPEGTNALLHLRTGSFVNGRELRGRIYIPGPVEGVNGDNGRPSSVFLNDVFTAAQDFLLEQGPGEKNIEVYSPTHNVSAQAVSLNMSQQWARLSTRRR